MSNDQLHVDDDRKMPIFIHSEVDKFPLTVEEFRVYAHLARIAGKKEFHASYTSIAKACFKASYPTAKDDTLRRKAITSVEKLEQYGLIRKKVEKDVCTGVHKRNRYSLTDTDEWKWPEVVAGDNGGGGAYALPQAPKKRPGGGVIAPRSAYTPRSAITPRSAYAPNSISSVVDSSSVNPQRVTPPTLAAATDSQRSQEEEEEEEIFVFSFESQELAEKCIRLQRECSSLLKGMSEDQVRGFCMLVLHGEVYTYIAEKLVREYPFIYLLRWTTDCARKQINGVEVGAGALVSNIRSGKPCREWPDINTEWFWRWWGRPEDQVNILTQAEDLQTDVVDDFPY